MNIPGKSERREFASQLIDNTVLGDWFSPLMAVLEKILCYIAHACFYTLWLHAAGSVAYLFERFGANHFSQ